MRTIPYIHTAVLEHGPQMFVQLLLRHAFFQDHLDKTAPTGAGDKLTVSQFLTDEQDLVNTRIRCTAVQLA